MIVTAEKARQIRKGLLREIREPLRERGQLGEAKRIRYTAGRDYMLQVPQDDGKLKDAGRVMVTDVHIDGDEIVLTLDVATRAERPRFLHRRMDRGYTSDPAQAVRGEPEVMEGGRHHDPFEQTHAELLRQRGKLNEDLDRLEILARRKAVNVRSDIRVIERRLLAIERKIREAA
jgi:hypothetical protein